MIWPRISMSSSVPAGAAPNGKSSANSRTKGRTTVQERPLNEHRQRY